MRGTLINNIFICVDIWDGDRNSPSPWRHPGMVTLNVQPSMQIDIYNTPSSNLFVSRHSSWNPVAQRPRTTCCRVRMSDRSLLAITLFPTAQERDRGVQVLLISKMFLLQSLHLLHFSYCTFVLLLSRKSQL